MHLWTRRQKFLIIFPKYFKNTKYSAMSATKIATFSLHEVAFASAAHRNGWPGYNVF